HAVERDQRRHVADAPPFEAIASKPGFNPELLAFSLLDPHPRMNVTLTRREARDVAAYIGSLAEKEEEQGQAKTRYGDSRARGEWSAPAFSASPPDRDRSRRSRRKRSRRCRIPIHSGIEPVPQTIGSMRIDRLLPARSRPAPSMRAATWPRS